MFEGKPKQMLASLTRLRNLPPETLMYCGHEYTAANLRFALTVEPANGASIEYQERVARLRTRDQPSLPSALSLERRVNPFLRCDVRDVREAAAAHAGRPLGLDEEVFGALRSWKDQFR
jgi:hydroxyacylglutathione hydrolase